MKGIRFYLAVLAVSGLGIAVNTAFAVSSVDSSTNGLDVIMVNVAD